MGYWFNFCQGRSVCIYFQDDFDRADSTNLGGYWSEILDDWAIYSYKLRNVLPGTTWLVQQTTPHPIPDESMCVGVSITPPVGAFDASAARVIVNYLDQDNYLYARYDFKNLKIEVWKRAGGSEGLINQADAPTLADDGEFQATVVFNKNRIIATASSVNEAAFDCTTPITGGYYSGLAVEGDGQSDYEVISETGILTSPTDAEEQMITLDSDIWGSEAPKLLLVKGTGQTADGGTAGALFAFGAATSSAEGTVAVAAEDAQATSDTDRRHDSTKTITLLDYAGNVVEEAEISQLGSGLFKLDWTTVSGNEYQYSWLVIGGDDVEVHLDLLQTPTDPGQVGYDGVGFKPDVQLAFTAANATAPPNTTANASIGLGFFDGVNQFCLAAWSEDGQAASDATRYQRSDRFLAFLGATVLEECSGVSLDTDGSTLNWTTVDANERYFWLLSIQAPHAKVAVDTQKTSAGVKSTDLGFAGKVGILGSFMAAASSNVEDGAKMAVGFLDDSGNQSCAGWTDEDDQDPTNARRLHDSDEVLKLTDFDGVVVATATGGFSAAAVSLNWTTADATARQWGGLFLGGHYGLKFDNYTVQQHSRTFADCCYQACACVDSVDERGYPIYSCVPRTLTLTFSGTGDFAGTLDGEEITLTLTPSDLIYGAMEWVGQCTICEADWSFKLVCKGNDPKDWILCHYGVDNYCVEGADGWQKPHPDCPLGANGANPHTTSCDAFSLEFGPFSISQPEFPFPGEYCPCLPTPGSGTYSIMVTE